MLADTGDCHGEHLKQKVKALSAQEITLRFSAPEITITRG